MPAAVRAPFDSAQAAKQAWKAARAQTDAGDHSQALATVDDALRTYPRSMDLRWLEAAIYGGMGNHRESVAHYEKLLADRPDLARDLRMDLATQRLWAGDPHGALRDFDMRIAEDPADREAKKMRALALSHADRLQESLAAYDQLRLEDASDDEVALDRARVLGWMGHHDQAIAAYREVLRRNPGETGALVGIAQNENWWGHHRRAASLYDSLRTLGENDPEVEKGLAFANYWSGRPARAQQALDRYMSRRPADPEAVDLASRIARERNAGFTAGYGRADDSDLLRVETRSLDLRFPLQGEAALLLGWTRADVKDPTGSFDARTVSGGLERSWGSLWTGRATLSYFRRDDQTEAFGLVDVSLAWRPTDVLRLDGGVAKDVVTTQRALQNAIIVRSFAGGFDWRATDGLLFHADARRRAYSDDNDATQFAGMVRWQVYSQRRVRARLAGRIERLHADQDLDHGYYDPERYVEGGPGIDLEWEPSHTWSFSLDARTGWQQENDADATSFYNVGGSAEILLPRFLVFHVDGGRSNSNLSSATGYERKQWSASLSRSF